jgi:hypothetical protein
MTTNQELRNMILSLEEFPYRDRAERLADMITRGITIAAEKGEVVFKTIIQGPMLLAEMVFKRVKKRFPEVFLEFEKENDEIIKVSLSWAL